MSTQCGFTSHLSGVDQLDGHIATPIYDTSPPAPISCPGTAPILTFFGLFCLFGPFRQKRRLFGRAATTALV